MTSAGTDRLRRWRLVLGGGSAAEGTAMERTQLSTEDTEVDGVLAALYDRREEEGQGGPRSAGLGASAPKVDQQSVRLDQLGFLQSFFLIGIHDQRSLVPSLKRTAPLQ